MSKVSSTKKVKVTAELKRIQLNKTKRDRKLLCFYMPFTVHMQLKASKSLRPYIDIINITGP